MLSSHRVDGTLQHQEKSSCLYIQEACAILRALVPTSAMAFSGAGLRIDLPSRTGDATGLLHLGAL